MTSVFIRDGFVLLFSEVSHFTSPLFSTNPPQLFFFPMSLCLYCTQSKPFIPTFLFVSMFCAVCPLHWLLLSLHWFCLHSLKDPWNNYILSKEQLADHFQDWTWHHWSDGAAAGSYGKLWFHLGFLLLKQLFWIVLQLPLAPKPCRSTEVVYDSCSQCTNHHMQIYLFL